MKEVAQLALAVHLRDDETFDSFQGELNQVAVAQLKLFLQNSFALDKTEQPNGFYLFGAQGSGKSHLLQACCALAEDSGKSSLCLSFSELKNLSVEVLDGLEHIDLICLDNLQLIGKDRLWQQGVFDLFNRISEQNKSIIITGDESANQLGITLPDLVSRLTWGFTEQVKAPNDDEKLQILQYRALQRGLVLHDDAAKFLLNRLDRNMNTLIKSLDSLDKASIREQRKITIPFIKDILL
jgi:DnaA family protein